MSVTLKKEKMVVKRYKVRGATLAEVWKDIVRKGPKDKGKNVAGLTITKLDANAGNAKFQPDGDIVENSDGSFTARAKFDRFELKHTANVTYPDHDGKLGRKPLFEWMKFIALLMAHEAEHVKRSEDEAETIVEEIKALRGEATASTQMDAARAASAELLKTYKKRFEGKLTGRLESIHKAFDGSSGHGPKLNTKIA